jgi:hypothetical protein
MTLCLAWRDQLDSIWLAADSRLNFGPAPVDSAVKIQSVTIPVYDPVAESTTDVSIGFAFAGSSTASWILKEQMLGVLQHSSLNPLTGVLSLEAIAESILALMNRIVDQLAPILRQDASTECIVACKCPELDEVAAYAISVWFDNGHQRNQKLERVAIMPGDVYFTGSGRVEAERRWSAGSHPVRILKGIIDDGVVPTVGGPPQAGAVENGRFTVKGVRVTHTDSQGIESPTFYISAVPVMGDNALDLGKTFVPTHPYLAL